MEFFNPETSLLTLYARALKNVRSVCFLNAFFFFPAFEAHIHSGGFTHAALRVVSQPQTGAPAII